MNSFLQRVRASLKLEAAAPNKEQLQIFLNDLAQRFSSAPFKFTPVRELRNLYPTLGIIKGTKYPWYLSTGSQEGKKLQISVGLEVEASNEMIRRGPNDPSYGVAEKELKQIGKALKDIGFKQFKLADLNIVGGRKSPPKASCIVVLDGMAGPAASGKWGIRVTSGDGRKTHVFTSTQHNLGPWPDEDTAVSHIQDLKRQLEYDDDFKHPTFKAVRL